MERCSNTPTIVLAAMAPEAAVAGTLLTGATGVHSEKVHIQHLFSHQNITKKYFLPYTRKGEISNHVKIFERCFVAWECLATAHLYTGTIRTSGTPQEMLMCQG